MTSALSVPSWFTDALAAPRTDGTVDVDGCSIHYRRWGATDRAGVILVHGGAAHCGWWDHIAPLLARHYCVTALDLSGHGDSGRRPEYSLETWSRELREVVEASGMTGRPVIVAHSMGGFVGMHTAACHADSFDGLVILDSPVRSATPEEEAARRGAAFGPLRLYPTREAALARFHTVPDQPTSLPYVLEHVAAESLRPTPEGWTWKFDPGFFRFVQVEADTLSRVQGRVALLRSEFGLVTEDIGQYMYTQLGRRAPVIELPEAWHHMMLDQPLCLVTALRTLLADWQHSSPRPPEPELSARPAGAAG